MANRTYKDNLTLDGRLKRVPGVSLTKVNAVKGLLEKHYAGDLIATATLTEALTSSDAIFNLAQLASINFVPQYDEAERNWRAIAGVRTAPDLKPVTLYTLSRNWTDGNGNSNVLSENGAAPVIPEGTPYPYAYISGQHAEGAAVVKRGFKTDWTLEARINDGLNSLDNLPGEMLEVSLDTEEADVWGALRTQMTAASDLNGGTNPDGAVVPDHAGLSRDALIRAKIDLAERTLDGRNITVQGGYNLIVPVGRALFADFIINQTLVQRQDDEFIYNITGGYNPLTDITVVETPWFTGTEWALMPKPGALRRPVLERLNLRGYETPQLFVQNLTGNFVGGGAVSPFEGSFDADVITLKLRQFGGGVLWDGGIAVVYSNGTGI